MKKILSLLALAAMFSLYSCQKDGTCKPTDGEITVTINTDFLGQLLTKGPGDGQAELINRYTLLVYANGSTTLYQAPQVNTTGSFTLSLVRGRDYVFAVWADCSTGPYVIGEDGVVSFNTSGVKVNDETCDAFFGTLSLANVQTNVSKSIVLKRPFGQLNIKATDYVTSVANGGTPNNITVNLKNVYTKFNILTGLVSDLQNNVTYSVPVTGQLLSFSYLFAPNANDYTIDVGANISFTTGSNQCGINVPEVQIKRNYRTTIEGDILTTIGLLNITIDPEFNGGSLIGIPVRISGLEMSFPTINAAVDHIKAYPGVGTKIIAIGGTYNEDIILPAGITLQGAGASTILTGYIQLNAGCTLKDFKHIWDGPATPRTAIYVGGSNVTLENIELEGTSKKADGSNSEAIVTIAGVSDFTVKNCKFTGYWKGIYLNNSENLTITGTEFINMNPFSVDNFDKSMQITGNTFNRIGAPYDTQQIHLVVTNTDAPTQTRTTWSGDLKTVVNQMINDNTWLNTKRIRVQTIAGTTFNSYVTAAI